MTAAFEHDVTGPRDVRFDELHLEPVIVRVRGVPAFALGIADIELEATRTDRLVDHIGLKVAPTSQLARLFGHLAPGVGDRRHRSPLHLTEPARVTPAATGLTISIAATLAA